MAKTFNSFRKSLEELYWPKGGDEAKFMGMHGAYDPIKIGGPGTHDDAVFKGTIVNKDESHADSESETRLDGQSELKDLIKNIHSRDTDELLKTVSHFNLSTDPTHRSMRDVINKELMARYKNHSMNEEKEVTADDDDEHDTPGGLGNRHPAQKLKKIIDTNGGHFTTSGGKKVALSGIQAKRLLALHNSMNKSEHRSRFIDAVHADPVGIHNKFFKEGYVLEDVIAEAESTYHDSGWKPMTQRTKDLVANPRRGGAKLLAKRGKKEAETDKDMKEELSAKQKKFMDLNHDGEISGADFAIRNSRKKKMGEEPNGDINMPSVKSKSVAEDMGMPYGFVPKGDREAFGQHMQKAGHQTAIQSDEPARDYSASANPRHGATKTHAAVRLNTPAAKAHAKKFPGFTTSVNEVDEGWVSVNGQRVGPRRQPMSFAQRVAAKGGERTPEQKAATEKALKRIEDKITVATGPKRSAEIDADLKKKRNAELTAAGRKPLPESDNKSRNIAKAVMGKKKVAENPELDKLVAREEIELEDGNVIEIDIELAEAIADLFDSLDDDDQDALAEMLHTDIDSFMEVVDFIENDGE